MRRSAWRLLSTGLLAVALGIAGACSSDAPSGPSPDGGDPLDAAGDGAARIDQGQKGDADADAHGGAQQDGIAPPGDTGSGADQGVPPAYACPQPAAGGSLIRVGATQTHQTIAAGLAAAKAGDVVVVAPGSYAESLTVSKGGTSASARLVLCSEQRRQAIVSASGRVFRVSAPWVTLQGFVVDGKWGAKDIVQADDAADHLVLRDLEIKNGGADGIDIGGGSSGGAESILIVDCTIHHLLAGDATSAGQKDAHCIVATDFRDLTIRNTEAYYCAGDSLQVGTDRDRWDNVVVEGCEFWTGPLPADAAGFKKGEVPGENAIDTKAKPYAAPWRGTIIVRDSVFYGFDPANAYIGNRAALNLKNQITGVVERCTIYDSEIGLRIRGGSGSYGGVDGMVLRNNVLHRNQFHARIEDDAKAVQFRHNTFGLQIDDQNAPLSAAATIVGNHYKNGGGGNEGPGWVSENNLFVGSKKPALAGSGDVATTATGTTFVDAANGNYRLKAQQNAAKGVGVKVDRDGKSRSLTAPDVGAYEL
jgi:hypothetical protein